MFCQGLLYWILDRRTDVGETSVSWYVQAMLARISSVERKSPPTEILIVNFSFSREVRPCAGLLSQNVTALLFDNRPPHHDRHKIAISATKSQTTHQSTFTVAFCVYLGLCWCVFLVGCSMWSRENVLFNIKNNQHNTTVDGQQLMPVSTKKGSSNQQSNSIIVSIGIQLVCILVMSSKEPFSGWLMRRCQTFWTTQQCAKQISTITVELSRMTLSKPLSREVIWHTLDSVVQLTFVVRLQRWRQRSPFSPR